MLEKDIFVRTHLHTAHIVVRIFINLLHSEVISQVSYPLAVIEV